VSSSTGLPGGGALPPTSPGHVPGDHPGPGAPTSHRRRLGLIVLAAVVAAAVVVALVVISTSRSNPSDATPKGAVRGFLNALAASDAAKALSYAAAPPADQALLTDAVLADSNRRAPLHDISVSTVSSGLYKVHYLLGDDAVDDSWTTRKVGGAYRLDYVSWLTLMPIGVGHRLPLLVNGQPTTDTGVDLFPVSYEFTTGLPTATWGPRSTMVVAIGKQDNDPRLTPQLTEQGTAELASGAQRALTTCLAQHALAPRACPFGFEQPEVGPQIDDSTVRWTVEGDPLRSLKPQINREYQSGYAEGRVDATFHVTCRYTTGAPCGSRPQTKTVNVAGDVTTSPMKVVLT
jgi:hypothetical protein